MKADAGKARSGALKGMTRSLNVRSGGNSKDGLKERLWEIHWMEFSTGL